jgi:hypothetical protein
MPDAFLVEDWKEGIVDPPFLFPGLGAEVLGNDNV